MIRRLLVLLALLSLSTPLIAGELTLANYNVLNFSSGSAGPRVDDFRIVLEDIQPDILVVQEMISQTSANYFKLQILDNLEPGVWNLAPYHDSYDTDRALFYKTEACEVLDNGWLDTDLRDIEWWELEIADSGQSLLLFSTHLKASQGSEEEQRRLAEVTVFRDYADQLPVDTHFIFCGDFNLYTAAEPAYGKLLEAGNGQCHDPIDTPGPWHNNYSFRYVHTQSPRTSSFGGGATGGLDDRFDFIMCSDEMLDGEGLELLPDTYTTWGNDGNHFNQAIIDGTNSAVSEEVANALHEASDHLPLAVTLAYEDSNAVPVGAPEGLALRVWPNPFNPQTAMRYSIPRPGNLRLEIFDVRGRHVALLADEHHEAGAYQVSWRAEDQSNGVYLARLSLDGETIASSRLVLLK